MFKRLKRWFTKPSPVYQVRSKQFTPVRAVYSPEFIAKQINTGVVSDYNGYTTIEIDCGGRRHGTNTQERQLLLANGYVELFAEYIIGWDIWILKEDKEALFLEASVYKMG